MHASDVFVTTRRLLLSGIMSFCIAPLSAQHESVKGSTHSLLNAVREVQNHVSADMSRCSIIGAYRNVSKTETGRYVVTHPWEFEVSFDTVPVATSSTINKEGRHSQTDHSLLPLNVHASIMNALGSDEAFKKKIVSHCGIDFSQVLIDVVTSRLDTTMAFPRRLEIFYYNKNAPGGWFTAPVTCLHSEFDASTGLFEHHWRDKPLPSVSAGATALFSLDARKNQNSPLHISATDVNCWLVRWANWSFMLSYDYRFGISLLNVELQNSGDTIMVASSIQLSDIRVLYGDTTLIWSRQAFDSRDYGVGRCMQTLVPGIDLSSSASFVNPVFVLPHGGVDSIPRGIGLVVSSGRYAYRHFDAVSGIGITAPDSILTLRTITNFGNYDYGIDYHFSAFGEIVGEVTLTGHLLREKHGGDNSMDHPKYGNYLADGGFSPNHEHIFSFRLDLDVHGTNNRVYECDMVRLPEGRENPQGNAISIDRDLIEHDLGALRRNDPHRSRMWLVANRDSAGDERGVALKLSSSALYGSPLIPSNIYQADVVVTQQNNTDYDLNEVGSRLTVNKPKKLYDTDVVLWCNLRAIHNPRSEEMAIMPAHRERFTLTPHNLIDSESQLGFGRILRHR